MFRRDIETILAAIAIDPDRRYLFVEGSRDRIFFAWLVGEKKHPDVLIEEIDNVDMPETPGGNRGRLIEFAKQVAERTDAIRCFADADYDEFIGYQVPSIVWKTDGKDIEGYAISLEAIEKVLRLGLGTETISAASLFESVITIGREVAFVRVLSARMALQLPFQKTDLKTYLKVDGIRATLNRENYLTALMQNAAISLKRSGELLAALDQLKTELAAVPSLKLIHGKDSIQILEKILKTKDVRAGEGGRLLWATFQREVAATKQELNNVVGFLTSKIVAAPSTKKA